MKWKYTDYLDQPTFFIKELKDFFIKKRKAEERAASHGRRTA